MKVSREQAMQFSTIETCVQCGIQQYADRMIDLGRLTVRGDGQFAEVGGYFHSRACLDAYVQGMIARMGYVESTRGSRMTMENNEE